MGLVSYKNGSSNGRNGLSYKQGYLVWGQDLGDPNQPAALQSAREIPLNGFNVYFDGTGNILIGSTIDNGYRLQVNGDLYCAGTNNSHIFFGAPFLQQGDVGGAIGGGNCCLQFYPSHLWMQDDGKAVDFLKAIGTFNSAGLGAPVTPVAYFHLAPTYNITGSGYTGTARGIFYDPTITSFSSGTHIALETTIGRVVLGSTSGNVLVGTSTDNGQRFQVAGNASLFHLIGSSAAPAIAAGTGAGTAPAVAVTGSDLSGSISVTTGAAPAAAAAIVTLTFAAAFGSAPRKILQPTNAAAIALAGNGPVASTTTTTLVLTSQGALAATTVYTWDYVTVQ